MGMFDKLYDNLKAKRRTIVFTEGMDKRIEDAANRILKEDLMDVILCGNPDEVLKNAKANGFDLSKATIIDPVSFPEFSQMVDLMTELRKVK